MAQVNLMAILSAKDNASGVFRSFGGTAKAALNEISGAVGKYTVMVTAALSAATGFAIKSASDYEQNRVAFDSLLGSAEEGKKKMGELSEFARKTPFTLPQVMTASKSLLAYGIASEDLIPTLRDLGNVASAVGVERLPNLIMAYGQVQTATKLTGMELRQFTEAGVPLLAMLAEQSGKSTAQIKDDMENGMGPSFDNVREAIRRYSEEGGDLMDRQSKTFGGVMSNISDQIGRTARSFLGLTDQGDIIEGKLFSRIKDGAKKVLDYLDQNQEKIVVFVEKFLKIGGIVIVIANVIGWVIKLAAFFGEGGLGAAIVSFLGGPAGWIIGGLILIAGTIALLWKKSEAFRSFIQDKLVPAFKNAGEIVRSMLEPAWNSLKESVEKLWIKLKELWEILGPRLMPMFKFWGAVLIGVVVAAIVVVGAVLYGLIKIIDWVVQGITWFADQWKKYSNQTDKEAKKLADAISNFFKVTIPNAIKFVIDWWVNLYNTIKSGVKVVLEYVVQLALRVEYFFMVTIPNAIEFVVNWFKRLPENIGFVVGFVLGYIYRLAMDVKNFFTVTIPEAIQSLINWFWKMVNDITTFLIDLGFKFWNFFTVTLPGAIETGINFLKTLPGKVWEIITNVFWTIINTLTDLAVRIWNWAVGVYNTVTDWLGKLPKRIGDIARDIWNNAVEGFNNFKDSATKWAQGVVDDIVDYFKGLPKKINEAVSGAISGVKGVIGKFLSGASQGFNVAVSGMANGGMVSSGTPYIVGERGPELFVPRSSGSIVPNNKLGGGVSINIYGTINTRNESEISDWGTKLARSIELASQGAI
jgi:tape measure domain-containing protein